MDLKRLGERLRELAIMARPMGPPRQAPPPPAPQTSAHGAEAGLGVQWHRLEAFGPSGRARPLAILIHNPNAGSGLGKKVFDLAELVRRFHAEGWDVGAIATQRPGQGAEAAHLAVASGATVVVAAGGDGTINEVVQGMAGQQVPMGVLPFGSVNILARDLGIGLDPYEAVEVITRGRVLAMDLGKVNGRYFACVMSVGYDAKAMESLIPELKRWTGNVAYMVAGMTSFLNYKSARATLTVEGSQGKKRLRRLLYLLVISNSGLYAGGILKFSPEAKLTDGVLDVCLIRSSRWYWAWYHFFLTLTGLVRQGHDAELFTAKTMEIVTARPVPYQLDGDWVGTTPIRLETEAGALRVMAPADLLEKGA